jgi:hypothetical protein
VHGHDRAGRGADHRSGKRGGLRCAEDRASDAGASAALLSKGSGEAGEMTPEATVEQKPSVGRIVHYTNLGDKDGRYPPEAQAAIVTGVYPAASTEPGCGSNLGEMHVDLHIFYKTGQFDMRGVPFSEVPLTRGHWNWPPRV